MIVADDAMMAKLNAFYDDAIAHIEARDYALCGNEDTSAGEIRPSSNARPEIAAGTPSLRSAWRSETSRMPPDACSCRSG